MLAETKHKIEQHIRKHRKAGGPVKGDDEAEKDLKMKPADRSGPNNVAKEAEEMKAKKGGRVKRKEGGHVEGEKAMHHAGRRHRASGGACESNPFSSAMKGMSPKGRSTDEVTKGGNH